MYFSTEYLPSKCSIPVPRFALAVDKMTDSHRSCSIRDGDALSDLLLGTLFIGCAHRINSVGAACGAHQGITVGKVADSDIHAPLAQSVSCRRGRIPCQSPDLMPFV